MIMQLLSDKKYCYILSVLYLRWLTAYYCSTTLIYAFIVNGLCKYVLFNTLIIDVNNIT
jgi:hypothetical protein